MNHSQALTLRAFLAALAEAGSLTPDQQTQLQAIGLDLEHRVGELHPFVTDSGNVALQTAYQTARRWLSAQAAERKAGLDFVLDNTPDLRPTEIDNTSRDVSPLESRLKALEATDLATLGDKAATVLSDPAPVQAVYVTFPGVY